MRSKFSSMWRVAIALVMVLSLGLVMAAPVSADVSTPTVDVDPPMENVVAEYTIGFDIITSLPIAGEIRVEFPPNTTVPTTYAAGDITVQGANVSASGALQVVTIVLATAISAPATVEVIFTTAAAIVNPGAGVALTLKVQTSAEPVYVDSEEYTILVLPVVTKLEPDSGNVGDTMWVEVTGSDFTGTDTTNVSDTTLNFGVGITVDSTKYIGTGEIDVQITINTAGAAIVTAETAAGISTTTGTFTANDADSPQVDVWVKYTPDDAIFVTNTLEFDVTAPTGNPFDTITEGIATAIGGTDADRYVLIVHAATYTNDSQAGYLVEGLQVDQNYVTIKSLSGAATTIIEQSGANFGVTLYGDGQTIQDLTINRGGTVGGQCGVRLSNVFNDFVGNDFTIKGCTFSDWDSSGYVEAVIGGNNYGRFSTGTTTTGLIEGNTFTGNSKSAIWLETDGGTLNGLIIKDNYFLGCLESDGHGIFLVGDIGTTTATAAVIEGNTISDMTGDGIVFWDDAFRPEGIATITDNDISGCTEGIDAYANWDLTITENTITNNSENGIRIGAGTQGTVVIKYNDISGNTEYGLKNEDAGNTYVAQYNWWNHISGPSDDAAVTDTTALGQGDVVTLRVTYDPWLTRIQATAVSDGIAYHGSTTPLEEGWNTLSVPLALDDSADTIAEIMDLGDFITNENVQIVYQYNEDEDGWENVGTSAIELVPCRGYYIKTLGTATVNFPVLYSGALGLPAFDLPAGWNLIGSAFGIDKTASDYGIAATSDSTDGQKAVNVALDSIKASCSVVISPSMPGQENVWSGLAAESTLYMTVGEGYWVFMTASATLAGFEVTPIYWIDLP